MIVVRCEAHGHDNRFEQPYQYHAGFGNEGFLYNDDGSLTLVWSSFDPAYEAVVGKVHPWVLDEESRARLESALQPAPTGGRWRFANLPRCATCGEPLGKSLADGGIYYLVYPGSLVLDTKDQPFGFSSVLTGLSAT